MYSIPCCLHVPVHPLSVNEVQSTRFIELGTMACVSGPLKDIIAHV